MWQEEKGSRLGEGRQDDWLACVQLCCPFLQGGRQPRGVPRAVIIDGSWHYHWGALETMSGGQVWESSGADRGQAQAQGRLPPDPHPEELL